jgi:glycosyltransferase involved in cell wall biosynthesis
MDGSKSFNRRGKTVKFVFLSVPTFEPWDWTNPDTVGIGGSETSHIEMSNRLSDRGHSVYSYGPTPFKPPTVNPHGVTWERCDNDQNIWKRDGVWVIYRDPESIDDVHPDNPAWLICQDVDYPALTAERAEKFTRIVTLCEPHGYYMRLKFPHLAHKIFVSSNGIKSEIIAEALKNPPERNPKRLMYASSPDRGLLHLATIFERAKEVIPDLELHVYYGFDNIEKIIHKLSPELRKKTNDIRRLLDQPGIEYHGRTAQPELIREWQKAGIWCHPSSFTETSCITCMDAQALGAVPITTPTWAVGDNVKHGVFIEGDPYQDNLVRARYVLELVKMASDPARQEEIRREMMPWAQAHFGWEKFVDQWEAWAKEDLAKVRQKNPARLELVTA